MERNENVSSYICAETPKKLYAANGTHVYYIFDNWRVALIELNVYLPKKNKKHIKIVIDIFARLL